MKLLSVHVILLALLTLAPAAHAQDDNHVFVTSSSGNGDLSTWPGSGGMTGLAGGDAICQGLADDAGLPGNYVAYLSDSTDDAFCRIHGLTGKRSNNCGQAEPIDAGDSEVWHRTDGRPFIRNAIDGHWPTDEVFYPLWLDENGQPRQERWVMTGSSEMGGVATSGGTCDDYSDPNESVAFGSTSETSSNWGSGSGGPCSISFNLLCFRTDQNPAGFKPDSRGIRQAFATTDRVYGNLTLEPDSDGLGGLEGADRICRNQAAEADLKDADTYKAFLSETGTSAFDRFNWPDLPWARLDGVLFAGDLPTLIDQGSETSLNHTPSGTYIGREYGWSGTESGGTPSADNCNDWSEAGDGISGTAMPINHAGSNWGINTSSGSWPCDPPIGRLFCLADSDLIFHDGIEG